MAQPTAYEQYFLELVNRARMDPAGEAARLGIGLNDGLAGGSISATPKQPLAFSPQLIDAARDHSAWMLATDTFSHTGAGGSSPGGRMAEAGYAFTGSWTWGENIAIQWGGGTGITAGQVRSFHDGLFRSAGHRENILQDAFKEVGIGLATGDYRGSPGATATEAFARPGTGSFLTGVAFDGDGDRFYDPGEGLGGVSVRMTAGSQSWQTTTWDAGGYQLKLPAGTYTVTFSGGGLALPVVKTATVGAANAKLDLDADAGGGGRDTLVGGAGADALTGGAGAGRFVTAALSEGGDRIADFRPSEGDRLDLGALLAAAAPGDAAGLSAGGFLRLTDTAGGMRVLVDPDGGGNAFREVAVLAGQTVAGLGQDFLLA